MSLTTVHVLTTIIPMDLGIHTCVRACRTPRDVGEMVKMLADATTAERHTTLTALQYQANIIHTLTVEIALFQDSELCAVGEKAEGTSDGARYVTTCAAVKGVELTRALLLRQLAEERDQHEVALDDVEDHLATELRIHGLTQQESNRTRRTILREKHEAHEAEDARFVENCAFICKCARIHASA